MASEYGLYWIKNKERDVQQVERRILRSGCVEHSEGGEERHDSLNVLDGLREDRDERVEVRGSLDGAREENHFSSRNTFFPVLFC